MLELILPQATLHSMNGGGEDVCAVIPHLITKPGVHGLGVLAILLFPECRISPLAEEAFILKNRENLSQKGKHTK